MNLNTHLSSIMIIFNFILFLRKCDDTYGENFSEKVKFKVIKIWEKKIESQHAKRIF